MKVYFTLLYSLVEASIVAPRCGLSVVEIGWSQSRKTGMRKGLRRWRIVFVTAVMCLPVLAVQPARTQQIKWPASEGGNSHVYELVITTESATWRGSYFDATARSFRTRTGHLATVTSQEEYEWLWYHVIKPGMPGQGIIYLGGWADGFLEATQVPGGSGFIGPQGQWHWITGENWHFEAWAEGEPSPEGGAVTSEWALSIIYDWPLPSGVLNGMNNLSFDYSGTGWTKAHLVEYDGLEAVDPPPFDHPVPVESNSSWGAVKCLYR